MKKTFFAAFVALLTPMLLSAQPVPVSNLAVADNGALRMPQFAAIPELPDENLEWSEWELISDGWGYFDTSTHSGFCEEYGVDSFWDGACNIFVASALDAPDFLKVRIDNVFGMADVVVYDYLPTGTLLMNNDMIVDTQTPVPQSIKDMISDAYDYFRIGVKTSSSMYQLDRYINLDLVLYISDMYLFAFQTSLVRTSNHVYNIGVNGWLIPEEDNASVEITALDQMLGTMRIFKCYSPILSSLADMVTNPDALGIEYQDVPINDEKTTASVSFDRSKSAEGSATLVFIPLDRDSRMAAPMCVREVRWNVPDTRNWTPLGPARLNDYIYTFFLGWEAAHGEPNMPYKITVPALSRTVEVEQLSDNYNIFRVKNAFTDSSIDRSEWLGYDVSPSEDFYIYIDATDPDNVIINNSYVGFAHNTASCDVLSGAGGKFNGGRIVFAQDGIMLSNRLLSDESLPYGLELTLFDHEEWVSGDEPAAVADNFVSAIANGITAAETVEAEACADQPGIYRIANPWTANAVGKPARGPAAGYATIDYLYIDVRHLERTTLLDSPYGSLPSKPGIFTGIVGPKGSLYVNTLANELLAAGADPESEEVLEGYGKCVDGVAMFPDQVLIATWVGEDDSEDPVVSDGSWYFNVSLPDIDVKVNDIAIAIEEMDMTLPATYYNLQGIRLDAPVKGQLVIERRGSKARKIVF